MSHNQNQCFCPKARDLATVLVFLTEVLGRLLLASGGQKWRPTVCIQTPCDTKDHFPQFRILCEAPTEQGPINSAAWLPSNCNKILISHHICGFYIKIKIADICETFVYSGSPSPQSLSMEQMCSQQRKFVHFIVCLSAFDVRYRSIKCSALFLF